MNEGERRQFLKRSALAAIAATVSTIGGNAHAGQDKPGTGAKDGSSVAHGVTRALAD
jgi:nitrous oxide reductase